MDEQLKQIGERLRGLRDVLDIPVEEMAETMEQTFRTHAERIYHDVIRILTESEASK